MQNRENLDVCGYNIYIYIYTYLVRDCTQYIGDCKNSGNPVLKQFEHRSFDVELGRTKSQDSQDFKVTRELETGGRKQFGTNRSWKLLS